MVEFVDTEIYPVEKSAEGTNAYYCEYCPAAGYRPNYASCLRRISDHKKGLLESNETACAAPIANGKACMAAVMLDQEEKAGRALYYVNRKKMRENQITNARAMGIKLGERIERTLASPKLNASSYRNTQPNAKLIPQGIEHKPEFKAAPTFADAINKRTKELAKEQAAEKATTANASPSESNQVSYSKDKSPVTNLDTKGLSLLEIAKLRKSQSLTN